MRRLLAIAVLAGALALSACSGQSVMAPIVKNVGDLQGDTIDLRVGQVLDIDTGDLDVDSYTATVSDTSIAEFVQGRDDGSAVFNPGITALAPGTTQVVLSNEQGGIEDVVFEVHVDQ